MHQLNSHLVTRLVSVHVLQHRHNRWVLWRLGLNPTPDHHSQTLIFPFFRSRKSPDTRRAYASVLPNKVVKITLLRCNKIPTSTLHLVSAWCSRESFLQHCPYDMQISSSLCRIDYKMDLTGGISLNFGKNKFSWNSWGQYSSTCAKSRCSQSGQGRIGRECPKIHHKKDPDTSRQDIRKGLMSVASVPKYGCCLSILNSKRNFPINSSPPAVSKAHKVIGNMHVKQHILMVLGQPYQDVQALRGGNA